MSIARIEETAILLAAARRPDAVRPQLTYEARKLLPTMEAETVWLAIVDACLDKKWLEKDDFRYRLTRRGVSILKLSLDEMKKLVSSAQYVDIS